MSRSTQGVTLINLDGDEKLAGLEKVIESDEEEDEQDNNGEGGSK
jgi:DNA gyrase subunit A